MSAPHVIVVGAGVIGLFCALRLAERGAQVTVLEGDEATPLMPSASRAAAGMLGPVSEAAHRAENPHPRAVELGLASFDLWRVHGASFGATFGGALILGDEVESAEKEARALGRPSRRLSRAELASTYGLTAGAEALFLEDEGAIDPTVALDTLRNRLREHGAEIVFETEAVRAARTDGPYIVDSDDIRHGADAIVFAPGAWARQSLQASIPALAHIAPAKGVLAMARLAQPLSANIRGDGFYLAARGRDAVLGATFEMDKGDQRAGQRDADVLFAAAERALPGQVARTEAPPWAGVRPMSPDWSPMIGPSGPKGCFVAAGHSRNGWLLAPITAEIICAHVFGEDIPPLWAAFNPARFETSS